ncbi:MAG: hypothetical protein JOZ54_09920 [Acidobacteria bacterium]|nr:hypothetical protein [Acidobacteriota bacterium]
MHPDINSNAQRNADLRTSVRYGAVISIGPLGAQAHIWVISPTVTTIMCCVVTFIVAFLVGFLIAVVVCRRIVSDTKYRTTVQHAWAWRTLVGTCDEMHEIIAEIARQSSRRLAELRAQLDRLVQSGGGSR